MEYNWNGTVESIAKKLIKEHDAFKSIREANPAIAYVECDNKKTSHGAPVYGDCEKVKPKMREFMDYDFVITVYPWCENLTVSQLTGVIFHELLHVGCSRDLEGNLHAAIIPHDVNDFHLIVDQFGVNWLADDNFDADSLKGKVNE